MKEFDYRTPRGLRETETLGGHKQTLVHTRTQPCVIQWRYEPCCTGPPKMDRSWWKVLTECGPLEKGIENHFSGLASRTPWTVWKGKKIGHQKWAPQVSRCAKCWWGEQRNSSRKNEEAGTKQKRCSVGWWLKSNAIKNNIAQEPGMLGSWII